MNNYIDGQSCGHSGCLSHVSHPCEGCGRIAGKSTIYTRIIDAVWNHHRPIFVISLAAEIGYDIVDVQDAVDKLQKEGTLERYFLDGDLLVGFTLSSMTRMHISDTKPSGWIKRWNIGS